MLDSTDMSTPVTRGELRDVLAQVLAPLATKVELEMWGGALLARIESGERLLKQLAERLVSGEQRLIERLVSTEQRLIERIDGTEQRLLTELARHTSAAQEDMSTQISVIDDKYDDLPVRVSLLEATVFPPRRR